jgi:hypothetical protein
VRIRITDSFLTALRGLSEGRRAWIIGRLEMFQANATDKVLRLRPLRCLDGHFIIDSVRYDRIILRREAEDLYAAVDCGGHEILEEWTKLHGGGAS